MRIHTSLTQSEIYNAAKISGAAVYFNHLERKASRTHAGAFEIRLGGSGTSRTNSGNRGAGDETAATWDEWGAFFGALFDADPDARCGGTAKRPIYADRDHYHFLTGDRFRPRTVARTLEHGGQPYPARTYMPEDTHKRHSWVYDGGPFACRKCSAEQPGYSADLTYRAAHQIGA